MPRHSILAVASLLQKQKELKEPLCALINATKGIQEGYRPLYNFVTLLGHRLDDNLTGFRLQSVQGWLIFATVWIALSNLRGSVSLRSDCWAA